MHKHSKTHSSHLMKKHLRIIQVQVWGVTYTNVSLQSSLQMRFNEYLIFFYMADVWVTVLGARKQQSILIVIQIQCPNYFSKQTTAVPCQMKWQVQKTIWQPSITTSHKALINQDNVSNDLKNICCSYVQQVFNIQHIRNISKGDYLPKLYNKRHFWIKVIQSYSMNPRNGVHKKYTTGPILCL